MTVRPELVEAADRRAEEADRSRSWVFERALERYLRPDAAARGAAVREEGAAYIPGLGPSRQAQLEADLALSPEERVGLAEETVRVAEARNGSVQRDRVILFTRLEEYLEWDRRERVHR